MMNGVSSYADPIHQDNDSLHSFLPCPVLPDPTRPNPTLHYPTLYSLLSTLYSLLCTLYSLLSTHYALLSTTSPFSTPPPLPPHPTWPRAGLGTGLGARTRAFGGARPTGRGERVSRSRRKKRGKRMRRRRREKVNRGHRRWQPQEEGPQEGLFWMSRPAHPEHFLKCYG